MWDHPEAPCLLEKHADTILRESGLTLTVHEPCLYSVMINGKRIIFKWQFEDFAIPAPHAETVNILLDMLEEKLTIPIKWQGYLDMYNGIDIAQIKDYIKISCKLFVEKISEKYMVVWMNKYIILATRPTPLPYDPNWMKKFNTAMGDLEKKHQAKLAKDMKLTYCHDQVLPGPCVCQRKIVTVKSLTPQTLLPWSLSRTKYLYIMRDDGIYF
jgi:hypothetical protein